MKEVKVLLGVLLFAGASIFFLSPRCYESTEEAWEACDRKYNGKCKFLGDAYQVCETKKASIFDELFSNSYKACLKIVEREGLQEWYCETESGREQIFNE
ncbi:hypothetical protein [Endozoicomonas ascidiicola]|uniref:hypothetical protein n=1 Tax=Endozoicomonas ascidiicola TaxID=1698521 RepID=UPI0012FBB3DF|nr:hypothetical protein [Endozoicomonas ascidiicola]USN27000.1 hypothetical protein [synthetic construct]